MNLMTSTFTVKILAERTEMHPLGAAFEIWISPTLESAAINVPKLLIRSTPAASLSCTEMNTGGLDFGGRLIVPMIFLMSEIISMVELKLSASAKTCWEFEAGYSEMQMDLLLPCQSGSFWYSSSEM